MERADTDIAGSGEEDHLFTLIDEVICEYSRTSHLSVAERIRVRKQLYAAIRGYGAIQELLDDPDVTEIMVNGPGKIFYEKDGRLLRASAEFESRERLDDIVQKIAAGANRVVNEASPIVDARLADGSRVNIVIPPVSVHSPIITVRKFPKEVMTLERLIELGSIDEEAADFLRRATGAKLNIMISGDNVIIGLSPSDFRKRGSHGGLVHICLRRQ